MNFSLIERVELIEELFDIMHGQTASSWQIATVKRFKENVPASVAEDLDFCFEVLAGKYKVGFTVFTTMSHTHKEFECKTIKSLVEAIRNFTEYDKTEYNIFHCCDRIPEAIQPFMVKLLNREYRLGYSNKAAMVTDKHCMLAKTYPEYVIEGQYYIQEKLNGNRCIAYYEDDEWKFLSRSQKPLKVNFDMTGFDTSRVYDGEIMTKNKMGNKDFTTTSGVINSKYADKSQLCYFIYDILDDKMQYADRLKEMKALESIIPNTNVFILPILDLIYVYTNPEYNHKLDEYLDRIVSKGGEGIMLRNPAAVYYHSKNSGDRKPCLLKYKKTKTCDLRITGWNEGKGKYEGMIGSFICESDDGTIKVSVAGISDSIRMSNPADWIGKIIEVAYFDISKSKNKDVASLQFPRMKCLRDDKTETSMF